MNQRPTTTEGLELSRIIQAPVERVFKAWTDPGMLRQWMCLDYLITDVTLNVAPGGVYMISGRGAKNDVFTISGAYHEVAANRRLVMSWCVRGELHNVPDTLLTVDFEPGEQANTTRLTLRHERFASESDRESHAEGWRMCVESLETLHKVQEMEAELRAAKQRLMAMRKQLKHVTSPDYTFRDQANREVRFSELFGGKEELIVVHNMGRACPYCTLWADGFNGVHQHLSSRAAFLVVSPDEPGVQREFARSRSWTFPMVSAYGTTFSRDMGFEPEPGRHWPGASTFKRNADKTIRRVAYTSFGPWDEFCSVFPMFEMLEKGQNNWTPKYVYG